MQIGDWVKFRIPHATQKNGTNRAGQIKEVMQSLGNVVIKCQFGSYYTVSTRLLNKTETGWMIEEVIR